MSSETPSIKPLQEAPANSAPTLVQSKIFKFKALHRGDCEQDDAQILFHSDGTGTFTCTTLTYKTHTGDVWHASFAVKGKNGAQLFSTKTFDSPRMNDGNPPPKYHWSAQFAYEPQWFDGIASVVQNCSC